MGTYKHCYYVCITTDKHRRILETAIINTSDERSNHLRFEELASNVLERNPECIYILYWEKYQNVFQAVDRERTIKKMSMKEKKEIISRTNSEWRFLNDKFYTAIR